MVGKYRATLTIAILAIAISFILAGCSQSIQVLNSDELANIEEPEAIQEELIQDSITISKKETHKRTIYIEKEKLHPELKGISEEKVDVVIEIKSKEEFEVVKEFLENNGAKVNGEFEVGGIISAEVPVEVLEELSKEDSIIEVAPEKEYFAFADHDDIPVFNHSFTGEGVRIAILDTGIASHDLIPNSIVSKSFVDEVSEDLQGHGTHIAGIAVSIAPNIELLNAKVLNQYGAGKTSGIIAGINWAIDPDGNPDTDDGADIISMSFGGAYSDIDGPLASTVRAAIDKGIIFVAASGNCRQGCGGFYGVTSPGNLPGVITVGAVDNSLNLASFSSGEEFDGYFKPDVVAPGVDIESTHLNNSMKTLSGTSMSTPYVSGIIALILENESLSPIEVQERLQNTAIDLGIEGPDDEFGWGFVDLNELFNENITSIEKPNATKPISSPITGVNLAREIELCILNNFLYKFEKSTVLLYSPESCVNCEVNLETEDGLFVTNNCFVKSLGTSGIAICLSDFSYIVDLTKDSISELRNKCIELEIPIEKDEEYYLDREEDDDDSPKKLTDEEIKEFLIKREYNLNYVRENPHGGNFSKIYSAEQAEFMKEYYSADKKRILHKLSSDGAHFNVSVKEEYNTESAEEIDIFKRLLVKFLK